MAHIQSLRSSDRLILIAMCIATFTDTFIYGMIVPILPYLLIQDGIILGDDRAQKWTSILLAAYGAALLLGSPLVGMISDHIRSRKIPLLVGYIAIAISTLLFLFGRSSALLVIARICQGFSGAVVGVLSFAVIADTARPERRAEYMAYASISFTWGMITGPVLGGVLFDRLGVYGAFGLPIFLLVVDIVLRLLIVEKKFEDRSPVQPDEESSLLARPSASENSLSLADFFERRFLTAVLMEVTISSILSAFETTLPLFTMQTYNWSSTNSGLVFLGISLPSLLSVPLGKYGQNWNRRRIVPVELILTFFPLAALRFVQDDTVANQVGFMGLVTLAGLFITTSQSQVMAEVSYVVREIEMKRGIDSRARSGMGTGYAFCNMAIALGQFIGPIIAGSARVKLGWEGMTLILGGTSCFVGFLSLMMSS